MSKIRRLEIITMNKDVLLQIPFVDKVPLDGRVVFIQPYFNREDNTYKLYFQREDTLGFVYAEPVEACYWAEEIVDETRDLFIPLLHITHPKRCSESKYHY
jgi:hypothetical protein